MVNATRGSRSPLRALACLALCLCLPAWCALPGRRERPLSPAAQALVDRAFRDLPAGVPLADHHVHLIGTGSGGSGCTVNPAMLSPLHPVKHLAARFYIRAGGVRHFKRFDEEYLDCLLRRARGFGHPVRLHLLAFDHFYAPDGTMLPERTDFFVPNDHVLRLAERHPDLIVPVVSVHPYRPDALAELERCARRGARWVKWLPNAQGMDPADPRIDPFYRKMAELGMTLLTHTGKEQAVDAKGAQELGNPLRLRRPLDLGLRVVAAHCASLGEGDDLDHPGRKVPNFELFLRLMGDKRYEGRLFGDLSALTQMNRTPGPMLTLLGHPEWQGRLLNGSDYPLPAVNLVIWTRQLARKRLITDAERKALNEIYRTNPLLFDVVLKRTLRHPDTGAGLAAGGFLEDEGRTAGRRL